jgi:DNA anti-recombination protein RmuC
MTKSDPSALVAAAAAFDDELATYARLGDLFLRAPTNTLKHLERANATLGELAQSEQRLAECGQRLIAALGGARLRQEQLSKQIIAHAPELQARNAKLNALMTALHALAEDVAKLNQGVLDAKQQPTAPGAADVSSAVLALSARAEQIAADARAAELPELAEQAHALHQRLQAIGNKLQKAGSN